MEVRLKNAGVATPGAPPTRLMMRGFSVFRPEGPAVNSPERQLGVGAIDNKRPKGPAPQTKCRAFGAHFISNPISRPNGRAYSLPALRA